MTAAKPPPGPALATFPLQEESDWRVSILLVLVRALHRRGDRCPQDRCRLPSAHSSSAPVFGALSPSDPARTTESAWRFRHHAGNPRASAARPGGATVAPWLSPGWPSP